MSYITATTCFAPHLFVTSLTSHDLSALYGSSMIESSFSPIQPCQEEVLL